MVQYSASCTARHYYTKPKRQPTNINLRGYLFRKIHLHIVIILRVDIQEMYIIPTAQQLKF